MSTARFHPASAPRARQRGATLAVGLIMIVLLTLIVVNAFNLSSGNLRSVGNMQVREEAISAANRAIELVVSSSFTDSPVAQSVEVDINNDSKVDYTVEVAVPECIRAFTAASAAPSDVELPTSMSSGSTWNTDWNIDATVTDASSGGKVRVQQGIRVLLTETQKNTVCA